RHPAARSLPRRSAASRRRARAFGRGCRPGTRAAPAGGDQPDPAPIGGRGSGARVMATRSGDLRVVVARTTLLLGQLTEPRRLQAGSQAAARPVTKLLDGIAGRVEQTGNEVKGHLSRALAAEGYAPATAAPGDAGRPRRGVDEGPRLRGFS